MTIIDTIIQDDIISKLETMTVANGYDSDISVLDGFMVHFANDLLSADDGIGFPCVAIQPESDTVIPSQDDTKAKIGRTVKLIGAVSAMDKSTVNANLNQLVYDVRRTLAIDKHDNVSLASDIKLGSVAYSLPDKQEQYAYFEMTISLNYVEKWI